MSSRLSFLPRQQISLPETVEPFFKLTISGATTLVRSESGFSPNVSCTKFFLLLFSSTSQTPLLLLCPLIDGAARIFPNYYSVTENQTRVSSVASLLSDLNPGYFTDWCCSKLLQLFSSFYLLQQSFLLLFPNRAFCQICEYYAYFAPSCTDKHEFFKGKSEVLPSLRDLIKDTVLKGRKRRKKPSTQGLSNPRPQELCSTGMCSSTVLQLLPRPALVFLGTCVLPYSLHMAQLQFYSYPLCCDRESNPSQ